MGWVIVIAIVIYLLVTYTETIVAIVGGLAFLLIALWGWAESREQREQEAEREAEEKARKFSEAIEPSHDLLSICRALQDSYASDFSDDEFEALSALIDGIDDLIQSQPSKTAIEEGSADLSDGQLEELRQRAHELDQEFQRLIQARNERAAQDGLYLAKLTSINRYLRTKDEPIHRFDMPETHRLALTLPKSLRTKHTYIIGKTGSGKTNLLFHSMLQDLENGHGLAAMAPDSDFFESKLLPRIPDHRVQDVVYFNPMDNERPVCFNPFEIGEDEDANLLAEDTITILNQAVADMSNASQAQAILRNAVYALTQMEGATLLDLPRLLDRADPSLRNRVVQDPQIDEPTRQFFGEAYPSYSKGAARPLLNRFDPFLRGRVAQALSANSLDFWEAIQNDRIVLVNLSTGLLGETPSQLLGQLMVSKLLTVILKRDAVPEPQRTPYYLYIDEFQTFTQHAADTFGTFLARARKYQLGLILAHQHTRQLPPDLLEEILANVGTTITMRIGDKDAARFRSILYTGTDPEEAKQLQGNLQRLPVGKAYVKMEGRQAQPVRVPLVDTPGSTERAHQVKEASREQFGQATDAEPERRQVVQESQPAASEDELYPDDWTNPEPS